MRAIAVFILIISLAVGAVAFWPFAILFLSVSLMGLGSTTK